MFLDLADLNLGEDWLRTVARQRRPVVRPPATTGLCRSLTPSTRKGTTVLGTHTGTPGVRPPYTQAVPRARSGGRPGPAPDLRAVLPTAAADDTPGMIALDPVYEEVDPMSPHPNEAKNPPPGVGLG